jgi:hypothetical protein
VNTNIALSKNFTYAKLKEHDNAYIRNISPLEKKPTFTNYFLSHPIIQSIIANDYTSLNGIKIGRERIVEEFLREARRLFNTGDFIGVIRMAIAFVAENEEIIDSKFIGAVVNKASPVQKALASIATGPLHIKDENKSLLDTFAKLHKDLAARAKK